MSALDGDGLLFLHGAGGRGLVWQLQRLAFPRAATPDLPGRAAPLSPEGDRWGVDLYLEALRASLRPGRRLIAGHSLGGAIALRWALRYPQEVAALILVGTGARLRVAPWILEGVRAADPATLEAFGALWFAPETDPSLREKSLALLRATPPAVLLADLVAADRFDVMPELDRLALPALVLCGAADQLTPVPFSRYLHEHLRGAELVVVPGAGHMVMLEQPRATTEAIRGFLGRLASAGRQASAAGDSTERPGARAGREEGP
jgi:pimeloyl-ACP methyl ester carboxylesterase